MPVPLVDTMLASDPTSRKAVFFCPDCGRNEPVDGDWIVRTNADGDEYVCPACRAVFFVQPRL